MKTIFRLLCGWMAIALAACTGDELQQIEPLQKPVAQKTISVKAYTPSEQAATRLAFTEETDGSLSLAWSDGDAFTADIGEEKVTFTYNADSKEFTANVNESVTLTDGIVAYYPAYEDEYTKDFSQQTGTLNSATTYMVGVYEGDAFSFNHSTAILKATFDDLPQDATISSIAVSGGVNVTISNPNATINKDAVYINLPAIAKDTELTFTVATTTNQVFTATKTVKAEKGIETGVYYNTIVELQEACLLPTGSEFNAAIRTVDSNENATSIVFEANVADETPATRSDSNYTIALAGNVLTISTPLSEFVFNADCFGMFDGLSTITAIDFNDCVNTSKVTTMYAMFSDCPLLESLDLSSFNTANVTNMASMFDDCSALTSLNVSSFNTANVTNMGSMFSDCQKLTSLDLSSFNTENVTDMDNMFNKCSALTSLDLSSFNTEKVKHMIYMFQDCSSLTSLNVSSFNTEKVKHMNYMFNNCSSLTSLDLSSFNTANVMFMFYMFNSCSSLTSLNVSSFNTANVMDMDYMFNNCSSLTSLDLSSFNTSKVTTMASMFDGCSALSSLDLSSFLLSSSPDLSGIFYDLGANLLNGAKTQICVISTESAWTADLLTNSNAEYIFPTCNLPTGNDFNTAINSFLQGKDLTQITFIANSANVNKTAQIGSSNAYMVANGETLEIHTAAPKFVFNEDCFDMFDGLSTITAINFNNCINTENVTDMGSMFDGCSALESLDLRSFNTGNVTNMGSMFDGCSSLTSLNVSSFNTSKVTDMASMFYGCSLLTSLNVSSFNTSKVTTMKYMFYDCFSIAELDLINFVFRNVTDFEDMFYCLAKNNTDPVPVYVYVTQAGYDILKNKDTGINSNYAWFVDEEGTKY